MRILCHSVFLCIVIAVTMGCAGSDARSISAEQYKAVLIHSHNDYLSSDPFWGAYNAGAASIEADVWWLGDQLYVAHDREEITPERTLLAMYLEPIRQALRDAGGKPIRDGRPLQLMVELKNEGEQSLDALVRLLEKEDLVPCFDPETQPQAVRLIITGDAIPIARWDSYPPYVFFDGRPGQALTDVQRSRAPLISQSKKSFSSWTGLGNMKKADQERIRAAVRQAHESGSKFRLWGVPDTPRAWELTIRLGIDYINTDQPARAAAWVNLKGNE